MDDFGMIIVVTLIKVGFMMILIGWIPALIAKNKGRNFLLWWIYGGALFIIALIHSLLINTQVATAKFDKITLGNSENNKSLKGSNIGTYTWRCDCGEINIKAADHCRKCDNPALR